MNERKEQTMSYQEILKEMVAVLGSPMAKRTFSDLNPEERGHLIFELQLHVRQLADLHKVLLGHGRRQERKRLGLEFTRLERIHPELAIARLFRHGRYLEFDRSNELLLKGLPMSMRPLANSYKENVEKFGRDSIAHLGLPYNLMAVLTEGVYIISADDEVWEPDERYRRTINTISQLRGHLDEPQVRFHHIDPIGAFIKIQKARAKLGAKLAEWDAIEEV